MHSLNLVRDRPEAVKSFGTTVSNVFTSYFLIR